MQTSGDRAAARAGRFFAGRAAALFIIALPQLLAGCMFMQVDLKQEARPFREQTLSGSGRDKILLMDISGVISSQESAALLGGERKESILARVREQLDRARKDGAIRAVVVRINSPGGGVTASDTLYHELRTYKRESGVKIIAHLMDMGTSGAYYAALAADRIIAQPTSVTGSIGVIMVRLDVSALMQKVGIEAVEISSGERKSMGSLFRPISREERALFQGVIDSLFDRFASTVAEERRLAPDAVKKVGDGRILTSQEAKAAGLIDGIGYLDDAIAAARAEAGITGGRVVSYLRPGDHRPTVYSLRPVNIELGELLEPGMKFMYLWWP